MTKLDFFIILLRIEKKEKKKRVLIQFYFLEEIKKRILRLGFFEMKNTFKKFEEGTLSSQFNPEGNPRRSNVGDKIFKEIQRNKSRIQGKDPFIFKSIFITISSKFSLALHLDIVKNSEIFLFITIIFVNISNPRLFTNLVFFMFFLYMLHLI